MFKSFRTILIFLLGVGILGVGAAQGMSDVFGIPNVFVQQEQTKKVDRPLYAPDEILLKSRRFIPEKGISSVLSEKIKSKAPKRSYVLLQFEQIPNEAEKKELEKKGIKLLSYIPNNAWFASLPGEKPEEITQLSNVRAITEILPEDKISPAVKNKNYLKNKDGTVNLLVKFFDDANLDETSLILEKYGEVVDKFSAINAIKLTAPEKFISEIVSEETVQWLDVIDKILQLHNDSNRANVDVNTLQVAPYNLSGANVTTSQWDGGWPDNTHDDLAGRITRGDAGCTETYCTVASHATHVAGTMLGNGALSAAKGGTALQWRGMATSATVVSYEWWDSSTELNNEYNSAINTYNASLSQNSWGYEYTGCGSDCSGGYDASAGELDGIIRGSKGKKISQIWSAGNNRPADCDSGNYDCIGLPSTAKNVITVGATNSDNDSMTFFSSWGPTNDGRLKPEVTAPGCEGDKNNGTVSGSVWSTVPTDNYAGYCGTSMAAPTVSGVIALMLEEFNRKGIYPLPSTIKALLVQTAKDLGNPGPDYSFGYGRIDAKKAVDKIQEDSTTTDVIKEESVAQGEYDELNMTVPVSQTSLKVTLSWDDYPAAANASPALVNNLDLVLTDPNGTVYKPWVLDKTNPSNNATTGINALDNTEQVYVANPLSGVWKVKVTGTTVPQGPQTYSLVSDFSFGIKPTVEVKTFRDSSYSQEDKFFDLGQAIYIQAKVIAGGSPVTGATVTAELILSSSTTETTLPLTEAGSGIYKNSWDSTPHTLDAYTIKITVSGPAAGEGKGYFHLYSGSGISAYQLDWDNDTVKDYVLENKHLVAIFDGRINTDKSLLYLYQKDTDVAYTLVDISDPDSAGRGEITTNNMRGITFGNFSLTPGENLASSTFELLADLSKAGPTTTQEKTLFSDGFESGNFTVGGWSLDSPPPVIGTEDVYEGIYSAGKKVYSGFSSSNYHRLWKTVNTTNCTNIVFNYARAVEDAGAGTVDFTAQYSLNGGGSWTTLETVNDTNDTFTYKNWSLPSGAGNNPNFVIRFGGVFDKTSASANDWWVDAVKVSGLCQVETTIETQFNIKIQMKSDEADYLVYKLSNFDGYIDDVANIFSPLAGTLGSSVSDDRYHFGSGADGLVSTLSAGAWTNFTTTTDKRRYAALYDNSVSSDPVNNNIISWIYFPNASSTAFQDFGAWYETGKEGLRLRYDTSTATSANQAEYLLAFTKGDFSKIDYWMPTIASAQLPNPNFMTTTTTLTRPNFPADSWQMISLPLLPTNPDPEAVLSDDLGNIFEDWILARWDSLAEDYRYHKASYSTSTGWSPSTSTLPNFSPGNGYWLVTRLGPFNIDATGTLVANSDYYIHLSPGASTTTGGWNQIGAPFNYLVAWSNSAIKVKNTATGQTVDLDTAQANGWLENKIWWWDGSQYQFAIAPQGQLDPWAGFWVHNFIECDLIVSPIPISGAAVMSGLENKPSRQIQDRSEWKLQLSASAGSSTSSEQASAQDIYNFIGVSKNSQDGYDAQDVLEPPAISNGVQLYFPHLDWSFNPGNYTQDIRNPNPKNKVEDWYFEIKNPDKEPVILKWLGIEQAEGLVLSGAEGYKLTLTDLDAEQIIDIYNTQQYDFANSELRHFKLTAKKGLSQR